MVSTNGYMFSWFLHQIIYYMHSANDYMYQIIHICIELCTYNPDTQSYAWLFIEISDVIQKTKVYHGQTFIWCI